MKKSIALVLLATLGISACQPANIIATKWDSGVHAPNLQTRCEQVDMRSKSEMDAAFSKYDGWKLVYVSEYTTGNRTGTDGVACFERTK